jgi:hypothetical protein
VSNRGKLDRMRRHYDFSEGVRGKYASRYAEGSNLVLLDPDVARAFPDPVALNALLRAVADATGARPSRPAKKRASTVKARSTVSARKRRSA